MLKSSISQNTWVKRMSDYQNRYNKERYDYLKELGLCPRCGKKKHAVGFVLCEDCIYKMAIREKNKEAERERNRNWYRTQKENGLCVSCGKEAQSGKVFCAACADKKNQRRASRRIRSVKNECKCIICKEPVFEEFKYCKEHYEQQRERMLSARTRAPKLKNDFLFARLA